MPKKEIVDKYARQVGEMTISEVAEKAEVTVRAVQKWKKEGKLAAKKRRIRVNGTIRLQLVFQEMHVEDFLNTRDLPIDYSAIDRKRTEFPFLTIGEAEAATRLSESCIVELISDGTLRKFTDRKGDVLISRKGLLQL